MDETNQASASAGLAGYYYQVDVSIYVALDLIIAQKRLDRITLEPANHEDLAGDLTDEARASAATALGLADDRLIVQAKLRNTEPWSLEDLEKLIARRDAEEDQSGADRRRKSPAALLNGDAQLRYLLMTSADLKGKARDLSVRAVGQWPATLPATLARLVPKGAGRIGVLAQLDEQKLEALIRELLLVTCKVPRIHVEACLAKLREIALWHMKNGPSDWTREALEATIAEFEGYLSNTSRVAAFVKPTNWRELVSALETRNAIVIVGSSGTGKTTAADMLLDHLKTKIDGAFKVVTVRGPYDVWNYRDPSPVVFMIEDPWGKYRFHADHRAWNTDLDRMLQEARKDRRFIVTTRSDVLSEAGATRLNAEWFVHLETRHYGQKERYQLFENRLRDLPEALKPSVHAARGRILERLESPYEIQKFFDGLRDGARSGETTPELISRSIERSHYDAIETTIVEQIEDRDDTPAAIAVWGLLKARPQLSWTAIPDITLALGDKDHTVEDRVEPLIRFMAAGRNIRQPKDVISYYHPRVEAGLERVIKANAARAARLLGLLVDVLLDQDDGDADWGQESAAQLVQGARRDDVAIRLSAAAQARLDGFLRRRLEVKGGQLEHDLKLAADVGSAGDTIADLARWLMARGKLFGNLDHWRDTKPTKAQAEVLAADPDVRALAGRFVRELLAGPRDSFPEDFAKRLSRVAGPQTDAFRDAALGMVAGGQSWNSEAVARGALVDFDGFEPVVTAAIAESRKLLGSNDDELWLEIRNGEHSEGYEEYLAERYYDQGDTADTFIKLFLADLRRLRGWRAILARPDRDDLLWTWIGLAAEPEATPEPEELEALADVSRGHRHESRFWDLAEDKWSPRLAGRLAGRLGDPSLDESTRRAVIEVMARHEPEAGKAALGAAAQAANLREVLRWMTDLKSAQQGYGVKNAVVAFAKIAPSAAEPFQTLARLVLTGEAAPLSDEDATSLNKIDAARVPDLQLAKARLLAASGRDARDLIEGLLATTGVKDEDIARAVTAFGLAIELGHWDVVEAGLGHRFADVRRAALVALAPREPDPLSARLLALAADKGSRVRQALVDLLKQRPHPAHQPTLVALTKDRWSRAQTYYGEEASFPIAEAAADLLAQQAPLSPDTVETLLATALETEDTDLLHALLGAVAAQGGDTGLDRLADIALEQGRPTIHAAAAHALYRAGVVAPSRAARFDLQQLTRRAAWIANNMALAVGATGEPDATLRLAKAIGADPQRAALLIPMSFAALRRDLDLANAIAGLLPEAVSQGMKAALEGGAPMPRTILEGLGEFRVHEAVMSSLPGLFQPKPAPLPPTRRKG